MTEERYFFVILLLGFKMEIYNEKMAENSWYYTIIHYL